jgi:hypothetical protein
MNFKLILERTAGALDLPGDGSVFVMRTYFPSRV